MDIVLDMETNDPDDFLTLLLLCGHPKSNLKAVTITPGSTEQVFLVRGALDWFGLGHIPVGGSKLQDKPGCVNPWHWRAYESEFGRGASQDARPAGEVLKEVCDEHTTLVCGAPLVNLRDAMSEGFKVGRCVIQGGFAGEGIIPRELQLEKFKGMTTCPSFNLNGCPEAALDIQTYDGVSEVVFVSKNVCHGVFYDWMMHDFVDLCKDDHPYLRLIYKGMGLYLEKKERKALHDPLAACCALDESVGQWVMNAEVYRERGGWRTWLRNGSKTKIIRGYDHAAFLSVLTGN